MQRVSSEEEGYDFSKITHGHWKENTPITQYLLIILFLPAPTIIYNLIIWTTHDFLIAHIVYQTLLVFLIMGYHFSISKLNFDVYYIHEVRNVNVQIRKGIIRMILFAVIISAIFVLLKYLNLKQANLKMDISKLKVKILVFIFTLLVNIFVSRSRMPRQ